MLGLRRLRERLGASASRLGRALAPLFGGRPLDAQSLADLEDLLIEADLGVQPAARIAAGVNRRMRGREPEAAEIREALSAEIATMLEPVAKPLPRRDAAPRVIVFVGVNGSGKTTTIGKFAAQFRNGGSRVVIAACDTFRAAAVEQLERWGERAGAPVVTGPPGGDPASVAFAAHERAAAEGAEYLLVDTAGRLQNKAALMEELAKIVRVIGKRDASAPHDVLLVLDASVGQNALSQAEGFQQAAGVTGLVMTKLDGSARGGALIAVADRTGLPVHAIGIGEGIDDLGPFDAHAFANAITGAGSEGGTNP